MDNSLIMEFNVSNQVLTRIDTRRVVEDSANYLYAHFNFSSDWNNIDKFIIVENKQLDLRFKVVIDEENKVKIPSSVIKHNGFSLMVVGQDENNYIVITTTTSMIQVLKTNYSDAEEEYIRNIISQTLTIIKEGNVASIEIPDVYFIDSNLTNDVLNFLNRNNEILQSIEMPYGKIHNISISINNTDYKLTLNAFDKDNNLLFSREADFDIESKAVSNFTYDSVNKTLILTLQNGGKFEVSIASLINGLQTEINANNKVSSAYIDDTNSANKFATLEQLNQIAINANNINNLNSNKLDKVTTTSAVMQAYVKLDNGTNQMLDVHWNNIRDTIPIRDQTGNIRVSLVPTNATHATSKQFVESQFLTDAEMETLLEEVFN